VPVVLGICLQQIHHLASTASGYASEVPPVDVFVQLSACITIILHSNFIHWDNQGVKPCKDKLKLVHQFEEQLTNLISRRQMHFGQGDLEHEWVDDATDEYHEALDIRGPYDILCELWERGGMFIPVPENPLQTKPPYNEEEVYRLHPALENKWIIHHRPTVHAEVRLILYLKANGDLQGRPMGGSKRCCACCTEFIQQYNSHERTKFTTSGSHGKPYPNWAFPDYEFLDFTAFLKRRSNTVLAWFEYNNSEGARRSPDAYASTGSPDSDTQGNLTKVMESLASAAGEWHGI
jgi:hypothetical protein